MEIVQPKQPVVSLYSPKSTEKPAQTKFHSFFSSSRRSSTPYIPPSTTHVPIVSIGSHEFEEIPSDVFDITIPPFMTVIPHILSPAEVTRKPHIGRVETGEEGAHDFNISQQWPGSKIRPILWSTMSVTTPSTTRSLPTQPSNVFTYTEDRPSVSF